MSSVLAEITGALQFGVALLLMAPIGYYLSNQVYEAGDGWIKIVGQREFSEKIIAVIVLAIGLPVTAFFASQIQSFLYQHLPSGIWLLPFIGLGLLGILWLVNDAANMDLRDGRTRSQILIGGCFLLIITPFLIQYAASTVDPNVLWHEIVVQPIMNGLVNPIRRYFSVILLVLVVSVYGYYRYTTS